MSGDSVSKGEPNEFNKSLEVESKKERVFFKTFEHKWKDAP